MATLAAPPPSVKPVTGTARWLRPLVLPRGTGRLSLTVRRATGRLVTTEYEVRCHLEGGRILGYRLTKDDGEFYDVDASFGPEPEHWDCDCKDFLARSHARGPCKHARGLYFALQ